MIPLSRNLVVLDLETTGTDPKTARIVELGFLLIKPDGTEQAYSTFFDPGGPIPKDATSVHGITNEMVKDAPTFSSYAERLAKGFTDVDIAGYHVKFDLAVLAEEFKRLDIQWAHTGAVIDAHRLWQILEPRTLSDASVFFLGEPFTGAHRASADVAQTWRILQVQLARAQQLPTVGNTLTSVNAVNNLLWPRPTDAVDAAGKIVWIQGVVCLGPWSKKYGGRPLTSVDKGYLRWILDNDFPSSTKKVLRDFLERGVLPRQAK